MPQSPVFSQLTLIVQDMDVGLGFYRRLGVTVDAELGPVHAAAHLPGGMLIEWDTIEFVAEWDRMRLTTPSGVAAMRSSMIPMATASAS